MSPYLLSIRNRDFTVSIPHPEWGGGSVKHEDLHKEISCLTYEVTIRGAGGGEIWRENQLIDKKLTKKDEFL